MLWHYKWVDCFIIFFLSSVALDKRTREGSLSTLTTTCQRGKLGFKVLIGTSRLSVWATTCPSTWLFLLRFKCSEPANQQQLPFLTTSSVLPFSLHCVSSPAPVFVVFKEKDWAAFPVPSVATPLLLGAYLTPVWGPCPSSHGRHSVYFASNSSYWVNLLESLIFLSCPWFWSLSSLFSDVFSDGLFVSLWVYK